jgi:hypothetical protein
LQTLAVGMIAHVLMSAQNGVSDRPLGMGLVVMIAIAVIGTMAFLYLKVARGYFDRGTRYGWAFLAPLVVGVPLIVIITVLVADH